MKKAIVTNKSISGIILAGLLISSLSVPLPVKAAQTPITISKQDIDQKIASIKKTINQMKTLKYAVTGLVFSVGVTVFVISAAVMITAAILSRKAPTRYSATEASIFNRLYKYKVALLAAGAIAIVSGIVTIPAGIGTYIGLSAPEVITAYKAAIKLENIEKQSPGILTQNQKTIVAQFKNLWRDPITRGAIKGLRIKAALATAARGALRSKPYLNPQLGGIKKAQKIIANYLKLSWQKRNLGIVIDAYNVTKAKLKATRDKHKKWTPAYLLANAKLAALNVNPKFLAVKFQYKKINKKIKKLEKQDPNLNKTLRNILLDFMQKADTIVIELKKPV